MSTVTAEPVVRRGVLVRDLEPEFVACGGTVNKSDPDHHKWSYRGLPTVGVHCNRKVAPRKLRAIVRRALAGNAPEPRDTLKERVLKALATLSLREMPDVIAGDAKRVAKLVDAPEKAVTRVLNASCRDRILIVLWGRRRVNRRRQRKGGVGPTRGKGRIVRQRRVNLFAWALPVLDALAELRQQRSEAQRARVQKRWERRPIPDVPPLQRPITSSLSSSEKEIVEKKLQGSIDKEHSVSRDRFAWRFNALRWNTRVARLRRELVDVRLEGLIREGARNLGVASPWDGLWGKRRLPESLARKLALRLAEGYEPSLLRFAADISINTRKPNEDWLAEKGPSALLLFWGHDEVRIFKSCKDILDREAEIEKGHIPAGMTEENLMNQRTRLLKKFSRLKSVKAIKYNGHLIDMVEVALSEVRSQARTKGADDD
jgi:hypothetical protein